VTKTPDKIKAALLHIKNNTECDSQLLDGYLVHDLVERGFITGWRNNEIVFGSAEPRYTKLRIKISGEEYLDNLNNSKAINRFKRWFSKNVVTVLVTATITVLITHYLPKFIASSQEKAQHSDPKSHTSKNESAR
jgi:hypothetical protein